MPHHHHPSAKKKSSREHKAAVELAKQRRQLSRVLKKEGVDPAKVFEKPSTDTEANHVPLNDVQEVEDQEKLRKEKLKARRARTKRLSQRTKKGQPLMKHMIGDIISKLES